MNVNDLHEYWRNAPTRVFLEAKRLFRIVGKSRNSDDEDVVCLLATLRRSIERAATTTRVTWSEATEVENEQRKTLFGARCGEGLKTIPSRVMESEGMGRSAADR